jgi:hypothetical protein
MEKKENFEVPVITFSLPHQVESTNEAKEDRRGLHVLHTPEGVSIEPNVEYV